MRVGDRQPPEGASISETQHACLRNCRRFTLPGERVQGQCKGTSGQTADMGVEGEEESKGRDASPPGSHR